MKLGQKLSRSDHVTCQLSLGRKQSRGGGAAYSHLRNGVVHQALDDAGGHPVIGDGTSA